MVLDRQLSGIYGSLTVELLTPYLNRKLHLMQRSKQLPSLPKGLVMPTVVAGLGGVGRGEDRAALIEFMQTVGQAMGPEALQQFIDPTEFYVSPPLLVSTLSTWSSPPRPWPMSSNRLSNTDDGTLIIRLASWQEPCGEQMMQQMNDSGQEAGTPPGADGQGPLQG